MGTPKVPTLLILFFFFFFFCLRIVWNYFKSRYCKAYLALFRLLDLEKKHKHASTVRVKIIISLLRAVVQN